LCLLKEIPKVRIKAEHTIGFLKGRFSSLRGLRQQIKDERDHELAVYWVISCLILHNLVLGIEGHLDSTDPFNHELLEEGLEGEWRGSHDDDGFDSYASNERFPDVGGVAKRHQLH
jgi:DDE superfamily endonuclease